METSLSVSTLFLRWFSVKRRQCGSSWDKCFLSKKKIHCREQDKGFWGCQWAGLLHTAGKSRECPLRCCGAPRPLAGRRWAEMDFRSYGEDCWRAVLSHHWKNEGEEDTKPFPLPLGFALLRNLPSQAPLCAFVHTTRLFWVTQRGDALGKQWWSAEPQRWSVVSMGLQGKDQQKPGRPALVTRVKAQAFLGSCCYLPRTDCGGSGQGICGSCHIALEHWGLNSNRRWVQATNAGVISNSYFENREQVYPWGILDGTHLVFSGMWGRSQPYCLSLGFVPALHTHMLRAVNNTSFQLEEKQHCKYVLSN